MQISIALVVSASLVFLSGPALASSSFQDTCSNIRFVYRHNDAMLEATCLRADGSANRTMLPIMGIGNDNGHLVNSNGPSSFQQSCGDIHVNVVDPATVTLSAICRTGAGNSRETGIPLDGIVNSNGNLQYR